MMGTMFGEWIVAIRKVRDTKSRGSIIVRDASEQYAREVAAQLKERMTDGWNVWAMKREDY